MAKAECIVRQQANASLIPHRKPAMKTLVKITNAAITAVALAPLAPVILLMWAVQKATQPRDARPRQATRPIRQSWTADTIGYCGAV